jgi:hypothetical protein
MGFLRRSVDWIVSARRRWIAWVIASRRRYILTAGCFWGGFMFACHVLAKGARITPGAVLSAIVVYGAGGLLFGALSWSRMRDLVRKQQALADSSSH